MRPNKDDTIRSMTTEIQKFAEKDKKRKHSPSRAEPLGDRDRHDKDEGNDDDGHDGDGAGSGSRDRDAPEQIPAPVTN